MGNFHVVQVGYTLNYLRDPVSDVALFEDDIFRYEKL